MNILLLSPLPPPVGGIATWTLLYKNSKEAKKNIVDIINTSVIGSRAITITEKNYFQEIYRFKKIYSELSSRLNTKNYDIVHINTSCSKFGLIRDCFLAKKAKRKKTKVVVHFHCDTSYMVKGKLHRYYFLKLCEIADRIFCLNTSSQKHIKIISNKESIIIPNFIDFDSKLMEKFEKIISDEIKNIIYVGHIVKRKGCDDIISVASKLPSIKFKMIGPVSNDIKEIPAPNNIEYLGEVSKDEVIEEMCDADLLLFPSHTEGFPYVILEAMACGLPIISTPVGAIPDMLENKGGILVNVKDVDAMVKAIEYLQNKYYRKSMSLWNQKKVINTYTTEIVMNKLFKEYSNVLGDPDTKLNMD